MSEHILKSFDDELTQLNTSIARMGQLSQTQLAGAIDSLLLRDSTVAAHVVKSDMEVDELERDVDARAIRVLALRQPIARDLRQVLASLRIAIEFERICDFAANIAKRAIALNAHSPDEWINELAELGQLALKLLADVGMNFIKVDGSLMQGLSTNQLQQQRVKLLVEAAKRKGIETVAERVEDANTMAVLWQLGIEFIQGYFVNAPEDVTMSGER